MESVAGSKRAAFGDAFGEYAKLRLENIAHCSDTGSLFRTVTEFDVTGANVGVVLALAAAVALGDVAGEGTTGRVEKVTLKPRPGWGRRTGGRQDDRREYERPKRSRINAPRVRTRTTCPLAPARREERDRDDETEPETRPQRLHRTALYSAPTQYQRPSI